jgi:hypothetical protein
MQHLQHLQEATMGSPKGLAISQVSLRVNTSGIQVALVAELDVMRTVKAWNAVSVVKRLSLLVLLAALLRHQ